MKSGILSTTTTAFELGTLLVDTTGSTAFGSNAFSANTNVAGNTASG